MECIKNCKLCNALVISTAVTFDGTSLVVDLPLGAYNDTQKYCIVIAQTIPDTTTINAPVVFTIGGVATPTYQFVNKCCEPVLASQLRTRRLYSTRVNTSIATGVFKYIGECDLPKIAGNSAVSLPVTAPAVGG